MKVSIKIALLVLSLIVWNSSSLTLAQSESSETELLTDLSTEQPLEMQVIQVQAPEEQTWFSVSSSVHYIIPSLDFHLGVTDALGQGTGLRGTFSSLWFDGGGFVAVGLNSITSLSDPTSTTNNYVGFGPRLLTIFSESYAADAYEPTSFTETYFAIGGLWGTEYYAQSNIRPYTEFNASVPIFTNSGLLEAFVPVFSVSAGFNFYF